MKNIRVFYLNIFQFLEVKFSIYLNRRVFVMPSPSQRAHDVYTTTLRHDVALTLILFYY